MNGTPEARKRRNRNWLAALASILPGAGHLLKKQMKRGLLILLPGNVIVTCTTLWMSYSFHSVFLITVPAVWILMVAVSAYRIRDRAGDNPLPMLFNGSDKYRF